MKEEREILELRRRTEIHEIEERKNGQIHALMKNHEKSFSNIKNYYNDITLNNLALINSLKEQIEEMKKKEERLEKEIAEAMVLFFTKNEIMNSTVSEISKKKFNKNLPKISKKFKNKKFRKISKKYNKNI